MADITQTVPKFQVKRTEYKEYLKKAGVSDNLTIAFMKLYEEDPKPDEPIEFLWNKMCEECPNGKVVTELMEQIKTLKAETKQIYEDINVTMSLVKKTPSEITSILDTQYAALQADLTGNSLLKDYLTKDKLKKFRTVKTACDATLLDNIQSGLEHFDSDIGIFASDQHAYEVFDTLFTGVLEDFHDAGFDPQSGGSVQHPVDSDWKGSYELEDLDPECIYIKSIRIIIGRSLDNFEFMPMLSAEKFEKIEEKIRKELVKIDVDGFRGTYHSLKQIDEEQVKKWIKDEILFPEPENKFLKAANTYRCWPIGRGIFLNEANNFRAWVNYEEHLQLITCDEGANLRNVFDRMARACYFLNDLEFAKHERWGFVTHNLKNIGNTIRIIVKVNLPKLSLKENSEEFETILINNKITAKCLGSGLYELTSGLRLGKTEIQTALLFQNGLKSIIAAEKCLCLKL